ncbi:MAG: DUF1007 family protein [Rhizobiaceae bacterium]
MRIFRRTQYAMAGFSRLISIAMIAFAGLALTGISASAHPHVFVEANLEVLRNKDGAVTELRHVWRFDELFSSTVLLDFDANGDGKLDASELDEVSKVVTESIGESDFFTEVRHGSSKLSFIPADAILVDFTDNQALMFFALKFEKPIEIGDSKDFRISVSDPSYYVSMDILDESAIQITGDGTACDVSITRPDFDLLMASGATLTEQFFADPQNAVLGDDWRTWIGLECS